MARLYFHGSLARLTETVAAESVAVAPAALVSRRREIAFDVLKGIGIAEVLAHHTLNWSARKFYVVQSPEWWAHMVFNRLLHFAIPTFLLASSILLARSLNRHERPDFGRYAKRRAALTVWPYLLWTAIYLVLRLVLFDRASINDTHTWNLPWGDFTGPAVLMDPSKIWLYLIWGKSHFHLYFMSVLIQLSMVLPLVLLAFRKVNFTFGQVVLTAAMLQIAFLVVNSNWIHVPFPGSIIFSYLPALMIGVWLGMNWSVWPAVWKRWRVWFIGMAVAATAPYLWLSIQVLLDSRIPPYVLAASTSVFATAAGLALLGLAESLQPESRTVRLLSHIGNLSLPLFLIHPIVLYLMGGRRGMAVLDAIPFTPVAAYLILIGLTWLLIQGIIRARLDRIFFGRHFNESRTSS